MVSAFERLHIHPDTYENDMETMAETFPGIALWVRNVEAKNKKAESHYAQSWLNVRRWVSSSISTTHPLFTNVAHRL